MALKKQNRAAAKSHHRPTDETEHDLVASPTARRGVPAHEPARPITGGAAQVGTASEPPTGLDAARHAAAQQSAHQAEGLRRAFVPGCMASALGRNGLFDAAAFRSYLDQFLSDAGDPPDPIERALVEQFAFAHLRLADLQSLAAGAKTVEETKVYSAAAARLFGELRRTAIARQVARERAPAPASKPRLRTVG